jgi:hypothetical protein
MTHGAATAGRLKTALQWVRDNHIKPAVVTNDRHPPERNVNNRVKHFAAIVH